VNDVSHATLQNAASMSDDTEGRVVIVLLRATEVAPTDAARMNE